MRSDNMPRPFAPEHGEEAASQLQRDIERIEPLIPFDPEARGAWQRIRTRIAEAQDDASEESQFLKDQTGT